MKLTKYLSLFVASLIVCFMIRPAAAQAPLMDLPAGQAIQQFVSNDQFSRQYQFTTLPNQSMFLMMVSQDYANAPTINISKQATDENIASLKTAVNGMCLRFAPGSDSYRVNVSADYAPGQQGDQYYGLLLVPGDPAQMFCPTDQLASMLSNSSTGTLLPGDTSSNGVGDTTPNNGSGDVIIQPTAIPDPGTVGLTPLPGTGDGTGDGQNGVNPIINPVNPLGVNGDVANTGVGVNLNPNGNSSLINVNGNAGNNGSLLNTQGNAVNNGSGGNGSLVNVNTNTNTGNSGGGNLVNLNGNAGNTQANANGGNSGVNANTQSSTAPSTNSNVNTGNGGTCVNALGIKVLCH